MPPASPPPPKRRWLVRLLWFFGRWGLVLAVWVVFALGLFAAWCAYDLPDIHLVSEVKHHSSVQLLGADGSTIASYGDLYGDMLRLNEMPASLIQAVIATEDRRFYHHFGIDTLGLVRAAYVNYRAGHVVQGGSSITQQLVKNVFLTPERSLHRKGQEMLLALWLEHEFSKDQILELYLNRVYFGAGAFGVDAAARKYFGKSARTLAPFESAVMAGLLKAPSKYNPLNDPEQTLQRTRIVLANMVAAGYLDRAQAAQIAAAPPPQVANPAPAAIGQYFADWVIDQVSSYVSADGHDLVVQTTFDPRIAALAQEDMTRVMEGQGAALGASQAALVTLSPNGAIRAILGGLNYRRSQYNRATQSLRQPGSSFKAFVFLSAFDAGMTPETHLTDGPVSIGKWRPGNYLDKFYGDVTLREAFAHSLNSVAVQLSERVGRRQVIATAHRLGVTADLPNHPAIALGSAEVSLLEMTAAYATFANLGRGVLAYGIERIATRDGRILYQRRGSGLGTVVTARSLASMLDVMGAVLDFGTGKKAKLDGWPAAGKTGTTQSYRDAWFIGLTSELVTGVWVGNDNGEAMEKVTGGSLPVQIWHDFMTRALQGKQPRAIPLPGGGGGGVANPGAAPPTPAPVAATEPVDTVASGKSGIEQLLDAIISDSNSSPPSPPQPTAPPVQ
jgi:penicillin-binding protein 1A